MSKIDRRKAEAIRRSIEWIVDHSTVGDNVEIKITVALPYLVASELLNNYLPADKSIPERTRRKAISLAVRRWLKYKKYYEHPDPVVALQQAYDTELRILSRQRRSYTVLMFLNIDSKSLDNFGEISVLGDVLIHPTWNELTELDINQVWKQVSLYDRSNQIIRDLGKGRFYPNSVLFSPIIFKINTFGPEAAIEVASDRIDILRCIFNLPNVLGNFFIFRSTPSALSKILPSPIYAIFDNTGQLVNVYHTIEKYKYKKERISVDQEESIRYLLALFAAIPQSDSSLHYLLSVMRQYQKALDISLPQTAYLAMWQVLERSVSLGDTINNREIEGRTSVLVELDPLFKDALHLLVKHRNDLVHSGVFPEHGDNIFFILKVITDAVISRLIQLTQQFQKTVELREYIRLATLSNKDLARKRQIIEKIIELRSQ